MGSVPPSLYRGSGILPAVPPAGALKNALLCLLAVSEPRHLITNEPSPLMLELLQVGGKTARRIFPRTAISTTKGDSAPSSELALNLALFPADLAAIIGTQPPSVYLKSFAEANPRLEQALASHLLPTGEDSPLWRDDYGAFITARADLIARRLRALSGFLD